MLGSRGLGRSRGTARLAAGASSVEVCESESSEEKLLWLETWKYCVVSALCAAAWPRGLGAAAVPRPRGLLGRGGHKRAAPRKPAWGGGVEGCV